MRLFAGDCIFFVARPPSEPTSSAPSRQTGCAHHKQRSATDVGPQTVSAAVFEWYVMAALNLNSPLCRLALFCQLLPRPRALSLPCELRASNATSSRTLDTFHASPVPRRSSASRKRFSVAGSSIRAPENRCLCRACKRRRLWRATIIAFLSRLGHGSVRENHPPLPSRPLLLGPKRVVLIPIVAWAKKGLIPSDKRSGKGLSLSLSSFSLTLTLS